MPYIAIKAFTKDEETKKRVVDKINQILLEDWGCPQKAVTISLEEVAPEDWAEKIVKKEMGPKKGHMMILNGEKLYEG